MRLDLLTSDWHRLIKPVLPHASKDKELPQLRHVRLELGVRSLCAIATDQATLGAERYVIREAIPYGSWPAVHLEATEVKASLGLLKYDKDSDMPIHVTVDHVPIPVGAGHSLISRAVTIDRPDDGLRLVLRDRRDPSRPSSLDSWRKGLSAAMTRPRGRSLDGLDLRGWMLARWGTAARGTERLRLWTGPKPGDPLLVTVEDHFAGLLSVAQQLDDPTQHRSALPWAAELLPAGISASGERQDDEG